MTQPVKPSLLKQLLTGGAVGVPVGGTLSGLSTVIDKPDVMTLPEEDTDIPIVTKGEKRPETKGSPYRDEKKKEKTAGVLSTLGAPSLAHYLGGAAGLAGGYAGVDHLVHKARSQRLNKVLESKKKELLDALIDEQRLAGGLQDLPVEPAVKAANEGSWAGMPVRDLLKPLLTWYENLTPAQKFFHGLVGAGSAATIGSSVYGKRKANNPNRLIEGSIKDSLKERLMASDPKLGLSPMVIKVNPETISTQPVKPGASALVDASRGKDILNLF